VNTTKRKVLILFRKYGLKVYEYIQEYRQKHYTPDLEVAMENHKYYIFLRDIIRTKKIEMFCL